jgi:mono/diheme cytochrome c family protein
LTPAAYQEPAAAPPADGAAAPGVPAVEDKTPYAKSFPPAIVDRLKVDPDKWMKRGQERYNIYCATCHGLEGYGDGLISLRAAELEQPTWAKPLSLHDEPIQQQDVGKLFRTITHGIRKMPSYGTQIAPEDRWAIVLYLRALQRSKDASIEDVPPADQDKLQAAK